MTRDEIVKYLELSSNPIYGMAADELRALTAENASLRRDVERLNQMIRETGYGQGSIDAYVDQCEELDTLKSKNAALHTQLQIAITCIDDLTGHWSQKWALDTVKAARKQIAEVQ